MSSKQNQSFIDRCYKDKDGKVVIFQSPNAPIIGWLIFTIAQKIVSTGTLHEVFSILTFGCLFTWGWLELFSGVNYFRRLIGLLIIIVSIMNRVGL